MKIWTVAPAAYQKGPETPYSYATVADWRRVAAQVLWRSRAESANLSVVHSFSQNRDMSLGLETSRGTPERSNAEQRSTAASMGQHFHKIAGTTDHAETTPQAINPGLTLRLAVLNSSDVFVEKRVYRFYSVSNVSRGTP